MAITFSDSRGNMREKIYNDDNLWLTKLIYYLGPTENNG